MDYEKKYKEALERARKFYNELAACRTKQKVAVIFPELTESEDERVRKWIIDFARGQIDGFKLVDNEESHKIAEIWEKAIAYLEKRKEHQNNSDAPEKALGRDLTFPQDKDKDLDEIAQDYVDGVKEYNPEPTWDLMQTAVCYGYHYREQEEQKPSDLPAGFYFIDQDGNKYYSKEFRYNNGTFTTTMKVKEEQKPAEWSEEDEAMRNNIIRVLSAFVGTVECESNPSLSSSYPTYRREIDWLKSLPMKCPKKSDNWKPSEEQMKALKKVTGNAVDADEYYPALATLYYDLKEQF